MQYGEPSGVGRVAGKQVIGLRGKEFLAGWP